MITHETYLRIERKLSPFRGILGWRLESIWGDLMHDLYLGSAGEAIASGLVELLEAGLLVQADCTNLLYFLEEGPTQRAST